MGRGLAKRNPVQEGESQQKKGRGRFLLKRAVSEGKDPLLFGRRGEEGR